MRTATVACAGLMVCAVAGAGEPPALHRPDRAPQELTAAVQAADVAIAALQKRLASRLFEELAAGGPLQAVSVCRDEAQALTAQVAAEQGIELGRTSHRLRNQRNAPRDWVAPFVKQWAGKRASEVDAVVVELGEKVGVLRPIPTGALCTQCHGPAESLSDELSSYLASAYPDDRAVGFAEGDLRGFFWAEAPR